MDLTRYPRVFVAQMPLTSNGGATPPRMRVDLTPAEKYGELVYLTEWRDFEKIDTDALMFKLRSALRDYGDEDYLLMVGNPTAMALAVLVASEINDGRVCLLYWRKEQREYITVDIDLNGGPSA